MSQEILTQENNITNRASRNVVEVFATFPTDPTVRSIYEVCNNLVGEQGDFWNGGSNQEPLSLETELQIIANAGKNLVGRQSDVISTVTEILDPKNNHFDANLRGKSPEVIRNRQLRIESPKLLNTAGELKTGLVYVDNAVDAAKNLGETIRALKAIEQLNVALSLADVEVSHPNSKPESLANKRAKAASWVFAGLGAVKLLASMLGGNEVATQQEVENELDKRESVKDLVAPAEMTVQQMMAKLSGSPTEVLDQAQQFIEQMVGNFQNEQEPDPTRVAEVPPVTEAESENEINTVLATATGTINVRSGAGTEHGVLSVLNPNDQIELVAKQGDWGIYETVGEDGETTYGFVFMPLFTSEEDFSQLLSYEEYLKLLENKTDSTDSETSAESSETQTGDTETTTARDDSQMTTETQSQTEVKLPKFITSGLVPEGQTIEQTLNSMPQAVTTVHSGSGAPIKHLSIAHAVLTGFKETEDPRVMEGVLKFNGTVNYNGITYNGEMPFKTIGFNGINVSRAYQVKRDIQGNSDFILPLRTASVITGGLTNQLSAYKELCTNASYKIENGFTLPVDDCASIFLSTEGVILTGLNKP